MGFYTGFTIATTMGDPGFHKTPWIAIGHGYTGYTMADPGGSRGPRLILVDFSGTQFSAIPRSLMWVKHGKTI